MSKLVMSYPGYVCAPYLHNHDSVELKETWLKSTNIKKLFFVTGTFSNESKPFFTASANHYLLAKFKDNAKIVKDLDRYNQSKMTFVFDIRDELFERQVQGNANLISMYYLDYGTKDDDLNEIANLLLKREKIARAGFGSLSTFCTVPSKFTFPYTDNVVVIEVVGEKGYPSVNKYCEQTRRDANRKGLTMTNMLSLSLLDHLK